MILIRGGSEVAADASSISLAKVSRIAPAGAPVELYSAHDLRSHLAQNRIQLSSVRKLATISLLVVGLLAWFVIPSYAADRPGPRTHVVSAPVTAPQGSGVISDGPISVVPPADANGAPVTGAGDGLLRTSVVGLCLLLAGLVVLTAPRRNPHAHAKWLESRL